MAIGFRKSLMGFNCEDVVNYIEKHNKEHSAKEESMKKEIAELNSNIEKLNSTVAALTEERDATEARLKEFNEKYEEIDKISKDISELYLITRNNAKAVIENSTENCNAAQSEIDKNFSTISEAHDALTDIRAEMSSINDSFSSRLEDLLNSLADTKKKITEKTADNRKYSENLKAVLEILDK